MAEALDQFIGDVADLEVGHHQNVSFAGDIGTGGFLCTDRRHQGGIGLKLAVDFQRRIQLLGKGGRFHHLIYHLVLCRAFGREAQHSHAGICEAGDAFGGTGGADCDLCQLAGIGGRGDCHISHDQDAILAELGSLGDHQHRTADAGDAGRALDDLEGRAKGLSGGGEGSAYLPVGIPALDDEAAEVKGIQHGLGGDLGGHTLVLAELV